MGKNFMFTTGDIRFTKKLFEEHHLPIAEIASQIGCSYNSLKNLLTRLRKQGIVTEDRNNKHTIVRRKKAIEMLEKGYCKHHICEHLGLHFNTVCAYAQSIGMKKIKRRYIKSPSRIHPWLVKNNAMKMRLNKNA